MNINIIHTNNILKVAILKSDTENINAKKYKHLKNDINKQLSKLKMI